MKTIKLLLAIAFLGGAIISTPSCGKYEDGPGFSLLTKTKRLCRDWDAKEYIYASGITATDTGTDIVTFEKDGVAKFTFGAIGYSGTWEFSSDKEKIKTTFDGDINESTILRLTNKELWIKDADGDITKFDAK